MVTQDPKLTAAPLARPVCGEDKLVVLSETKTLQFKYRIRNSVCFVWEMSYSGIIDFIHTWSITQ